MKYFKIFGKTFNLSFILPLSFVISAFLFVLNFILTIILACSGNHFFAITFFLLIFFEIITPVILWVSLDLKCFDFIDDFKKKYIIYDKKE